MPDMTPEVHQWLESKFSSLALQIENVLSKMIDVTEPMKKDIDHLRDDISVLFDRSRSVENDVGKLMSAKEDKKTSTGTVVAVVGLVLMIFVAGIGWLM